MSHLGSTPSLFSLAPSDSGPAHFSRPKKVFTESTALTVSVPFVSPAAEHLLTDYIDVVDYVEHVV